LWKTLGLILNFMKQKHSTACLSLTYSKDREVKPRVILVGVIWTIHDNHTDKTVADLNLNYHKIK
jgi:hypothetical protein